MGDLGFPCVSNVSLTQPDFVKFFLYWTDGCSPGTNLILRAKYSREPSIVSTPVLVPSSSETRHVLFFFLNSENVVEVRRAEDDSLLHATTFTSLAAPPILRSTGTPFAEVEPRSLTLEWDSDTFPQGPIYKNPPGTIYEVQLATSATFDFPITKTVAPPSSPTATSIGCLSPETTYYSRVRAINRVGIPTDFLFLGSTMTHPSVTLPVSYMWMGDRWKLSLSVGELSDEDVIHFNGTPLTTPLSSPMLPEKIGTANEKLKGEADPRRRPLSNALVEIQASRACPATLKQELNHTANLAYAFVSSGGQVDTGAGFVRQETLSFYRLDLQAGVWNKIPSRVEGGQVTATVEELGTLAVMGQEDVSLHDLRVFPNPFHQGTDSYVTFANMAERVTLRIFTPSGREVRRLEETDGDGILLWDGRNSDGDPVESGVYVFHVKSPGAEKKGKVMVLK